ncbi:MAG: efflux RND transporter periplasmic adaptor subunit [Oscillospiraceae bacterium]
MKQISKQRALVLLCTALTLGATGCSKKDIAPQEKPAVPVTVQAPARGNLSQTTAFTGRVLPDDSVAIIPKLSGEVAATFFEVGDTVKKGDVLFSINPTLYDLQVQQADAGVKAAQAAVRAIEASIALAKGSSYDAQLLQSESALKQAQSARKWTDDTYDIYDDSYSATSNLLRSKVKQAEQGMKAAEAAYLALKEIPETDPKEVQGALDAYQIAKTAWQTADNAYDDFTGSYETQYNQLTQGLEQAEIGSDAAQRAYDLLASGKSLQEQLAVYQAQLEQAQSGYQQALTGLEQAKTQRGYASVTTPIAGVIEQKNVMRDGIATQSAPAYVVSDPGSLSVVFQVPSDAAHVLALEDAVTVEAGQKSYHARVVEIGNAVSAQSGLFSVKARLEGDTAGLLSGMAVKLTTDTAKVQNALLIPVKAIFYDVGNPYVYVVRDNKAVKTPIEVSLIAHDNAAVLSGLTQDDALIVTWSPNLGDGVALDVRQEG